MVREYRDIPPNRTASFSGDILPDEARRRDIGSATMEWRKIYAREIEAVSVIVSGGYDADTLDGYDSAAFTRKAEDATVTGAWTFNANITMGAGNTVDGVDISGHATRHEISGADTVGHDSLTGFVGDEHVAHAGVTMTAGNGLSGGGTIALTRTFDVGPAELITGGNAEVDGDKLDIDWNPSNYTPATTPSEVDSIDNLTAHLYGIDQVLGGVGADLTDETFVVMSLSGDLDNERVLTAGDGVDLTDGGAGVTATVAVDVTDILGSGLTESSNNIDLDWGTPTIDTIVVGDSPNAGSGTNPTRSDHQHGVTTSSNPGAAAAILASNSSGRLELEGLGIGATPSDHLSLGDAVQIQWGDVVLSRAAANELQLATGDTFRVERIEGLAAANLTIAPDGDVIFDPIGNDILPNTGYDLNLGSLTTKYLTLHAAELWVETLVAQETIATIGGRVLVGPTTVLTSDLGSGSTTMYVKHNEMANGDIAYMEANGKVEFIAIASAPGGVGPYSYTVTRNLDGTGANDWYAGDAVFNTGTTGNGFIDLYSFTGKAGAWIDDETGANWGTAYHGLSLANGQAFIDVDNVDLSTYAGTEGSNTPYRIILRDSANKSAHGFIGAADAGRTYGSELLSNVGFESFTGTPNDNITDDFDNWIEVGSGSGDILDATTTNHGGTYAVKLTYGNDGCHLYQDVSATAGKLYKFTMWTRGDGTFDAGFQVEDQTGAADIIAKTQTGVTGTTYTLKEYYFTAPSGCSTVRIYLHSSTGSGAVYFDDVSVKELTDGRVTGVHIVSAVNGSTRNWESIESGFDYNDTSYTFDVRGPQGGVGPTIVGNVRNSASWNDWSEHWAIGNLEGIYGYGSATYGIGLGKYSAADYVTIDTTNGIRFLDSGNVVQAQLTSSVWTLGEVAASKSNVQITSGAVKLRTNTADHIVLGTDGSLWAGDSSSTERMEWDSTNGLRIFDHANSAVIQFDISGNADITNKIRMPGTSSAIAVGATPPTSSSAGTGIWIDRTGFYALDTGVYQVKIDATDGILYAGGGYTTISADGVRIEVPATFAKSRSYQFVDDSGTELGGTYGQNPPGSHSVRVAAQSVTGEDSSLILLSHSPTGKAATNQWSVNSGGAFVGGMNLVKDSTGVVTWKFESDGTFEFELVGGSSSTFRIEDEFNNDLFVLDGDEGDVRISEGLFVGNMTTNPGAGEILATSAVSGLYPMGVHDLLPGTGTSTHSHNLYSGTISRNITVRSWHQAFFIDGFNNASNYWTIELVESDLTNIVTVTTASMSGSIWTILSATGIDTALTTSDIAIRVRITAKTGSPGELYWQGPAVFVT